MSRANTLFERLRIDDVELLSYAFSHLKLKHRQILRKAYGYDLKGYFDSSYLTEEEKKNGIFAAIRALKNILQSTDVIQVTIDPGQVREDSPYFYERFGEYDPRDVYIAFQGLDDSYQTVFKKVYGNYLLDSFQEDSLSEKEMELFILGSHLLKQILKNFNPVFLSHTSTYQIGYQYIPKRRGTKPKDVFALNPEYSKEEVLSAIDKLREEDRRYLKIAYGDHYCDISGYYKMSTKEKSHLLWIIRGKLKYFLEHPNQAEEMESTEERLYHPYSLYSDYSRKEIKEAMRRLSQADEELIEKVFSGGKHTFISSKDISVEEFQYLKNIIIKELKQKLSYVRDTHHLFQYFHHYSEEEILYGIYQLSNDGIVFLRGLYGDDFQKVREKDLSRDNIRQLDYYLRSLEMRIRNEEVYRMNIEEKILREDDKKRINSVVTSDFVHDRLHNLPYRKLSRQEEIDFIKKTRLSYYDSVDEETQKLYLEYYMEMFPSFRKSWEEADDSKKERLLKKAIQNSLYYRNKFLENNFRLVFSVAKRYVAADDLENLYQEGVLGMMRALRKFDISKGFRFSTYATLWIRQAVTRYIADNSSTIRVPVHRREQITRLERLESQLTAQLGRSPSNEELAKALDVDEEQLDEIREYQSYLVPTSLNSPVGEDEDITLEEFLPSNDEEISVEVENSMMRDAFRKFIENDSKLSEREKKVLFMRYGFYDGRFHTLDEIGQYFQVTRERIRQIESKSLKILRVHLKNSSFDIEDDYSMGTSSLKDTDLMRPLPTVREPIAKPKIIHTVSRDSNGKVRTHKTLAFQMDSRERDNIILEVLSKTDMRRFDSDTREILNLRYGLCGVRASVEDTARILNLSEQVVSQKENDALNIIFAEVSEDDLDAQQVKKMIRKK